MFNSASGAIFHDFFLSSVDFLQKKSFKIFQEHYQGANSLDPDQAQHIVMPDLGKNCSQRLSAEDESHHQQAKSDLMDMQ